MSKVISVNELQDGSMQELLMPSRKREWITSKRVKEYGTIELKYFNTGNGIAYCHYQNMFYDDTRLEGISESDYSFIAFNTGKSIRMQPLTTHKEIELHPNLCFSGHMHQGHQSYGLYAKEENYSKHFIIIDTRQFQHFCSNVPLPHIQKPLSHYSDESFLINYAQNITKQQSRLLGEISQAETLFQGSLQEIYLESKILELIYSFFSIPIVSCTPKTTDVNLSTDDIKSLEKAKKILLNNLQNPPSLKELASKSAINEFKLKQGFKKLFGTTVYGIVHEQRLENAKDLLLSHEISVQEAAKNVGYHSMGYFSKIFKDKFGVYPIQMKQKRVFYYDSKEI